METGTWYTKAVEAGCEEVFYEVLRLLDREKWVVESYHNQSEILAESGLIFPEGMDSGPNTEIIIVHPGERSSPNTSEADLVVPIVIIETDEVSIISTVGGETFNSVFSNSSEQNNEMLWEELTTIIDDAAAEATS
ncbi:hypothetical protein [Haloarchaeobius salinus]|uniref:hypothetical protein n=1 Tax=Haloarchaeobius salinus TaxID=1198298 RepID=UPI00210AC7BD|nr:hypothetical protein [Haloarchaeobius salinus]